MRAFVLATAMPPTIGHLHLIQWAAQLAPHVTVIVSTQPHEPFASERYLAVNDAVRNMHSRWQQTGQVTVSWLNRPLPQDPSTPGFWELWHDLMREFGFRDGDICVSSESYGATLAERLNGKFMVYDPNRQLYYTKATKIRENPSKYFSDILPEFQRHLMGRVTFFGAESTGKTTTSHEISTNLNAHWLFEWARPYLETMGPEISVASMTDIWEGQRATQDHANLWHDKHLIVQDTDLFSTVGYWAQPHWQNELGPVPTGLIDDAVSRKSDLYIILSSNIPFEHDTIRYGGDVRESPDQYWIDLAEQYELPYIVIEQSNFIERVSWSEKHIKDMWAEKYGSKIAYDRGGL